MSDHRFGLKVEFSIYGETFEWEPSLNWNDHDTVAGCDKRIAEWFASCYGKAKAKWDSDNAREDAAHEEDRERTLLAHLKAKYEQPGDAGASPGVTDRLGTYTVTDDFERSGEVLGPEFPGSYRLKGFGMRSGDGAGMPPAGASPWRF